jgi:hypothetical protein
MARAATSSWPGNDALGGRVLARQAFPVQKPDWRIWQAAFERCPRRARLLARAAGQRPCVLAADGKAPAVRSLRLLMAIRTTHKGHSILECGKLTGTGDGVVAAASRFPQNTL